MAKFSRNSFVWGHWREAMRGRVARRAAGWLGEERLKAEMLMLWVPRRTKRDSLSCSCA